MAGTARTASESRHASLGSDALWSMIGAAAQAGQQAAIVVAFTRWGSPELLGTYALGLALAAPLNVFADRAIRTLLTTARNHEFVLPDCLVVRSLVSLASLAMTLLLAIVWRLDVESAAILGLVGALRWLEGLAQAMYGRMHQRRQVQRLGVSQLGRAVISGAVGVAVFACTGSPLLMLGVSGGLQMLILFCLDWPRVKEECSPSTDYGAPSRLARYWPMLRQAVPIGATTFLVAVSVNIPRMVLARTAGEITLGVLTVLVYLSFPATLVSSALVQAATPRFASHRSDWLGEGRRLMRRLLISNVAIAVLNAVCMVAIGGLLPVFSAEYAEPVRLLPGLGVAVGIGFLGNVPGTALVARRRFRLAFLACVLSCATSAAASFFWIPRYEIGGVVWVMALTNGVHWIACSAGLRFVDCQAPRRLERREGAECGSTTLANRSIRPAA